MVGVHWIDFLLLMMIYLGARCRSYFADEQYVRAAFMMSVAFLISVFFSCLGSAISIGSEKEAFFSSLFPVFGFLLYDVVYAAVGASLDRQTQDTWIADVLRHLAFSVPLILILPLLNYLAIFLLVSRMQVSSYGSLIIAILFDYLLISTFWAYKSRIHANKRENRRLGESVSERFLRSSATNVSLYVSTVILWAVLLFLGNAGLKTAGVTSAPIF